jgi:hypothetical protein
MNSFLNHLSSYDYFGHNVVFTFNKNEDNVHRTVFGGILSIVMRFGMVGYIALLLQRMITRSYDFDYEYATAYNNGDDWT